MSGHARNSPSAATMWTLCAGSLNRIEQLGLGDDRTSEVGAEGTAAHTICESCLLFGFEPYEFVGMKVQADGFTFVVDNAMAEALQPGIDRIRDFDGEMFIEHRVNTTPWVGRDKEGNEQFGTLDTGIIMEDEIVIRDLKYGRGIPVQAVGNKQIRIYGLGFWEEIAKHRTDAKKFRFIIDQPRNNQGGGEWVQTLDQLLEFGEWVKERAAATFEDDAPCTPSLDACQWCPAAKVTNACPEHLEWKLDLMTLDFEDLDDEFGVGLVMPPVQSITPERRSYLIQHKSLVNKFFEQLQAEAMVDALAGRPVPGLKAVYGRRPARKHKDVAKSEAWLRENAYSDDQIFNKELLSPTQLEHSIGRGVFPIDLVERGEPKPTLVPVDDERPEIFSIDQEFEDQ